MIADELRRQADTFLELHELAPTSRANIARRSRSTTTRMTTRTTTRPTAAAEPLLPERLNQSRGIHRRRAGPVRRRRPPTVTLCPRLAAFRAATEALSGLAQRAGRLVRRPGGATADRRPRPGTARRKPHRAPVHRRSCRRDPLLAPCCASVSRAATTAPPRRRPRAVDCRITNAVRCVPPQNRPIGAEVNRCRAFLLGELRRAAARRGRAARRPSPMAPWLRALGLPAHAILSAGAPYPAPAARPWPPPITARATT